jgi:2-methylisocitrate lyase-like PEP mutase family enzyme
MAPTADRDPSELAETARLLHALHRAGDPLVLVNVWDAAGAVRVQRAGARAIATSSAAIDASLGQPDDNSGDPDAVFAVITRIVGAADLPVTADLEGGYHLDASELIERLLGAGAVGFNIEDSDHAHPGSLVDPSAHADRIASLRAAADASGVDVVINARVDTIARAGDRTVDEVLPETLDRSRRYLDAGATCVYPIRLSDPAVVRTMVDELRAPVNVNLAAEGPGSTVGDQAAVGAARVSLGGRPFHVAMAAFDELAARVLG